VPIAAHAVVAGDRLTLRALVAAIDGTRAVRGERSGLAAEANALGEALGEELLGKGAAEILRACEGVLPGLSPP